MAKAPSLTEQLVEYKHNAELAEVALTVDREWKAEADRREREFALALIAIIRAAGTGGLSWAKDELRVVVRKEHFGEAILYTLECSHLSAADDGVRVYTVKRTQP